MTSLSCPYCSRKYKQRHAFKRHMLLCELLHAPKKGSRSRRDEDEDEGDPPSASHMYDLLVELASKYEALQEKFDRMQKTLAPRKQRITVLQWLQRTHAENESYQDWCDKLQIKRKNLELVFQMGHKKGVAEILVEHLPEGGTDPDSAMLSFSQHPSTIFLHDADGGWRAATTADMESLIGKITRLLTAEFVRWQEENKTKLSTDDFAVELMRRVRCATGTDGSVSDVVAHVRRKLCLHLRTKAYTLVECDTTGVSGCGSRDGECGLHSDPTDAGIVRAV